MRGADVLTAFIWLVLLGLVVVPRITARVRRRRRRFTSWVRILDIEPSRINQIRRDRVWTDDPSPAPRRRAS